MTQIQLPVKEIISRYCDGESQSQLAERFGVDRRTIRRRLVKANIPIRSDGEASKLRKNRDFEETSFLNGMIDGLMLSDAWIEQNPKQDNARLAIEVRRDYKDWLKQISYVFTSHDVKHSIRHRKSRKKKIKGLDAISKETAILRTGLYGNFALQKARWYPNGIKTVPEDLNLQPISLAHWYCGDGCTSKYMVRIYTNNFSKDGCQALINQILTKFDVRFKMSLSRGQPVLDLFNNSERERFLNIIRSYIPDCFEYKIKNPTIIRRSKIWR